MVGGIISRMDQDKKIDLLVKTVENLAVKIESHDQRFDQQDKKIDTLVDTVENLAIMVKEGFERVATKEDLQNLSYRVDDLAEGLDAVKADTKEIKIGFVSYPRGLAVGVSGTKHHGCFSE